MLASRILTLVLLLTLVAFVGACGGDQAMDEPVVTNPEPTPPPPPPVEKPTETEPVMEEPMGDPVLNDVFFAFDKYNLTAEARSTLNANASELEKYKDARIIIEGHCDERGTKSYNLALGEKRANAARDYLVNRGISATRITTVSYGKERPFDLGHNEAAWAKNRRAHFKIQ